MVNTGREHQRTVKNLNGLAEILVSGLEERLGLRIPEEEREALVVQLGVL